ncbi:hypothetical protein ECG_04488 [Echinococcus granulosus]|uniref:G-protein coupled receptor n=1 Tax=Echinococcus granulosus TaxID=6210 RepID=A0A068WHV2_ECHGR|nr:hypothetical protein ECG_04488 [Echinococcus granulosus]CDS17229.1 g-protein coupled receptor [Echinococcus granulosus]
MVDCSDVVNTLFTLVASVRFFISPLLFVLGIGANIMVFYLFLTNKPLTRYNLYPIALSIFESIVLLLNAFIDDFLGRGLYYFSNGNVRIKVDTASLSACQFFEFAESWSSFVAAYIMLAFGIDRVLSIGLPHRFQRDRHICSTILLYLGIMVVGAALSAPIAAGSELKYESQATTKVWFPGATKRIEYYTKVNVTVITFLIPTFLLVTINCIIIGQMLIRKTTHPTVNDPSESRTEMRRVITYLLISFVSFACTLPLTVTICVRAGHDFTTPRCEFSIVAELSRLFNSTKDIQYACHGYTYIFFFKFFRNRLKQMCSRMWENCCCRVERVLTKRSPNPEITQVTHISTK